MRYYFQFFTVVFLLFVLDLKLSAQSNSISTNEQPNFLFVLVDDQPYDALGFMGRYPFLKTPNIDRLFREGANVENFFVTQSICSPSRASFLTGTYPHIHGVNQNNRHVDPNWDEFAPYTKHLQAVGYETAHIGKIHMAHKKGKAHIRPGFDYWFSFIGQGKYIDPPVNENGKEYREKGYMTDILTEKAISWLKDKRDPDKPFSLNLWHKAVHEPHIPAKRHENLYSDAALPAPPFDTHKETFLGKPAWQRKKTFGFDWKKQRPIPKALPEQQWPINYEKNMQLLRCIAAIDESLGEVLKTLESIGELDNTVVIYSSDNGYFMGEHTFNDKRLAYENSMRVPMLIRYPKLIKPKTTVKQQCLNIDMAPTILDMAGLDVPAYMQGASMQDLLIGTSANDWRTSFLFEYYLDTYWPYAGPNQIAVRTKRYKLVDAFLKNDIDELYDLKNDPGEMKNLINSMDHKDVEAELRAEA
ncbi:MAG: sulfatase, partial [Bacteroidota bacterium]|nr:sulfatase [Bacteroidota bacterium]